MLKYDYLLIGGGLASDAAAKGIRELDKVGSIALVGDEPDPPYARPPLSKKLWMGKPLESIWRGTDGVGVTLHLGRRVIRVDRKSRTVTDDHGDSYGYGRLLLATGGTPRRFRFGGDSIIYFRTLQDYWRLRGIADKKGRVAVVGGGFIGSEIAASLAANGCQVVHIFPEAAICSRVFPPELAGFVTDYYRKNGVEVISGESITDLRQEGERSLLLMERGDELSVDGVVAGLGIELNLELAVDAGLYQDNGIVADDFLKTNDPDIFVAGDVANFNSHVLESRVRVEHEDNAISMGRQAGRNMAGADEPYRHIPFFYSDLFDLGYEAVGELDSRMEIVSDWQEPFRKGVLYYLRNGRLRGVLLWNVWDKVDAARALLAEAAQIKQETLAGRITP